MEMADYIVALKRLAIRLVFTPAERLWNLPHRVPFLKYLQ